MFATTNNAPWDVLWAVLASIVFIGAVVGPAALLNAREQRRRERESS
ncbi:MAG: hypothetical protein ACP5VR_13725 [Acidimicrobiales bacterium]